MTDSNPGVVFLQDVRLTERSIEPVKRRLRRACPGYVLWINAQPHPTQQKRRTATTATLIHAAWAYAASPIKNLGLHSNQLNCWTVLSGYFSTAQGDTRANHQSCGTAGNRTHASRVRTRGFPTRPRGPDSLLYVVCGEPHFCECT